MMMMIQLMIMTTMMMTMMMTMMIIMMIMVFFFLQKPFFVVVGIQYLKLYYSDKRWFQTSVSLFHGMEKSRPADIETGPQPCIT